MSIEQHRDAGLLLHLRVGAHEREDPVAVLAERGPGLLAVDDPVVAVAYGGGAQARQVGAGVGLGEALRPPDVEVGGLRQEALLLLLAAELREHRPDHRGVEGERDRHSRALHLLVPQVPLQVGPALAAPLLRPVRHGEARGVERLLALDDLVAGQVPTLQHRVADVLRELGGEERPASRHGTPRRLGTAPAACAPRRRAGGTAGPAAPSWRGRPSQRRLPRSARRGVGVQHEVAASAPRRRASR